MLAVFVLFCVAGCIWELHKVRSLALLKAESIGEYSLERDCATSILSGKFVVAKMSEGAAEFRPSVGAVLVGNAFDFQSNNFGICFIKTTRIFL